MQRRYGNLLIKKRLKKEWKEANMTREDWRKHFMDLLGGVEITIQVAKEINRYVQFEGAETKVPKVQEIGKKSLTEEDLKQAVRKMKLNKTARADGISIEAWRFGGEIVKKRINGSHRYGLERL